MKVPVELSEDCYGDLSVPIMNGYSIGGVKTHQVGKKSLGGVKIDQVGKSETTSKIR